MATREFRSLKRNIDLLKSQFLNFEKRVNGRYTRQELLNCRAFVAFVHAEFESYFESVADNILTRAKKNWKKSGRAGTVISGLLAFRNDSKATIASDIAKPGDRQTLEYCICFSIASQEKIIQTNNGIKPDNFSNLFSPLGVTKNHVDEALSIQLENFGSRRGGLVHSGAQISLPRIRDPFDDEYSDVEFLLKEVAAFDEKVGGFR
ncbi:HEPN domain-containing protein [Parasphingorhabdus sp.]|uniref:HEPN domain-containing protein n=1 Tax=Parasphingorhabdus sp. TaxID=2709688 RepID=UPI0030017F9D